MLKRAIALILALTLIFSTVSCGRTKEADMADAPLYEKTQIGEKASLAAPRLMKMNLEGHIVVFNGSETAPRYAVIAPSGTLINQIICAPKDAGHVFFVDLNDNLYILNEKFIFDASGENPQSVEYTVNKFDSSGTKIKAISLGSKPLDAPGSAQATGIAVDNDDNIYILNRGIGIDQYDRNGMFVKTLSTGFYEGMEMDVKENLVVLSVNKANKEYLVKKIDPTKGNEIWSTKLDQIPYRITYNKFNGHIYILNKNGIDKYDKDGNYISTIMNFNKTYIGKPDEINGMFIDKEENVYFTVEGSQVIDKYTKSDKQPVEPAEKKTFTINIRFDYPIPIYRKAFEILKLQHPEFELDIKTIEYSMRDENVFQTLKDIETTLITEMLAGKGPDIIEFSSFHIPYQKFADKKLLVDINELIENDPEFDIEKYYKNYIYRNTYKGSLYIMPLTFSYIAIAANKSLLHREGFHIDDTNWTWRDMLDISKAFSKALDDGTRYRYAFPSNQYVLPWEVEYMRFIDREKKTCSFNSKEFIEILELSKEMMDSNIISPDIGWGSRDAFSPANKDRLLFVYVVVDSEGQINDIRRFFHYNDIEILKFPSFDGRSGEIEVVPYIHFGINSNSKYKDIAWEFLKILLDTKMQEEFAENYGGAPVNKAARINIRESILKQYEIEKAANTPRQYYKAPEDVELLDKFIKMYDVEVSSNAGEQNYDEYLLESILRKEIRSYINGEKSAEETASIIQDKVTTYLNE